MGTPTREAQGAEGAPSFGDELDSCFDASPEFGGPALRCQGTGRRTAAAEVEEPESEISLGPAGPMPGWLVVAAPVTESAEHRAFGAAELLSAEPVGPDVGAEGRDVTLEEPLTDPDAKVVVAIEPAGTHPLDTSSAAALVSTTAAAAVSSTLSAEPESDTRSGEALSPGRQSEPAPVPAGAEQLDPAAGIARAPERVRKPKSGVEIAFAVRLEDVADSGRPAGKAGLAGGPAAGVPPEKGEAKVVPNVAPGGAAGTSGAETAPAAGTRIETPPGQNRTPDTGLEKSGRIREPDAAAGDSKPSEPRVEKPKSPDGDQQSQSSERREQPARSHSNPGPGREQPASITSLDGRQPAQQTSLRTAPAARPAQAAAAPEWEPPRETISAPVRDLSFELPAAVGNQRGGVQVRFVERGGEVYVAVRSEDRELANTLRGDLNHLAESMENQGYRAEIWRASEPARTGYQETAGGEPRDQARSGGRNSGGDPRRQGRYRPGWLAALEEEKGERS